MTRFLFSLSLLVAGSPLCAQSNLPRVVKPLQDAVPVLTGHSTPPGSPIFVHIDGRAVDIYDQEGKALRRYPLPLPDTSSAQLGATEIWITVPDAETVNVFNTDHKLVRQVYISPETQRVVPFGKGYVALGDGGDRFAIVHDSANRETRVLQTPSWVAQMTRQARAPITAWHTEGWAVAFKYTGRILVQSAGSDLLREVPVVQSRAALPDTTYEVEGPDGHLSVTRRHPASVVTVRALAWSSGDLYVLAGGTGETAGRYVDVYDGKSLAYTHSYMLPRAATDMIVNANGIVTYEHVGKPMIYLYPFK